MASARLLLVLLPSVPVSGFPAAFGLSLSLLSRASASTGKKQARHGTGEKKTYYPLAELGNGMRGGAPQSTIAAVSCISCIIALVNGPVTHSLRSLTAGNCGYSRGPLAPFIQLTSQPGPFCLCFSLPTSCEIDPSPVPHAQLPVCFVSAARHGGACNSELRERVGSLGSTYCIAGSSLVASRGGCQLFRSLSQSLSNTGFPNTTGMHSGCLQPLLTLASVACPWRFPLLC